MWLWPRRDARPDVRPDASQAWGQGGAQKRADLTLMLSSVSLNFVCIHGQLQDLPSVTDLSGLEGISEGHLIHSPASV